MTRQDEFPHRGCAGTPSGRHGPSRRTLAVLFVAGLSGGFGVAYAQVPTAGDIAGCNREAGERLQSGAASPTSKDEVGADAARKARDEIAKLPGASGYPTHSADPQIHGMDGAGAQDAVYRAAYRVCMRRRGF